VHPHSLEYANGMYWLKKHHVVCMPKVTDGPLLVLCGTCLQYMLPMGCNQQRRDPGTGCG
jgi:hypothetical protein